MVLANLEDREIYADLFAQLPTERQAQTITGKVQDAILKQEAAISVKYTYKKILDLLKKVTYIRFSLMKLKLIKKFEGYVLFRCGIKRFRIRFKKSNAMYIQNYRIRTNCYGEFGR